MVIYVHIASHQINTWFNKYFLALQYGYYNTLKNGDISIRLSFSLVNHISVRIRLIKKIEVKNYMFVFDIYNICISIRLSISLVNYISVRIRLIKKNSSKEWNVRFYPQRGQIENFRQGGAKSYDWPVNFFTPPPNRLEFLK